MTIICHGGLVLCRMHAGRAMLRSNSLWLCGAGQVFVRVHSVVCPLAVTGLQVSLLRGDERLNRVKPASPPTLVAGEVLLSYRH